MAWWLAYEELYGDMDKEYPIMIDKNRVTPQESDEYDPITILGGSDEGTVTFTVPEGAVAAADTINIGSPIFGSPSPDTISLEDDNVVFTGTPFPGGMGEDHITFNTGVAGTQYDDPKYYASAVDFAVGSMGSSTKPQPDLTKSHKYEEDKGIKDLKDYVASTYSGHYTSKNNNVQTLDLIQSVGDAESFCRSNAIKYLSRYDKRGQAKRDILKAMHYCLLLYYFSGQTNETPTRGYETF